MVNETNLKQLLKTNPGMLKEMMMAFDKNEEYLDDTLIDALLGIDSDTTEKGVDTFHLAQSFGFEQYKYEGTPYNFIRHFLRVLEPRRNDKIFDLGAGYGRVVLYGALTTPAQYTGIELVPERVIKAREIVDSFRITNAQFIEGNVLKQDYSQGNIFFLFNPFLKETLQSVGEQLEKIAQNKPIKIVTWGGPSNDYFTDQYWVEELHLPVNPFPHLQFFISNYRTHKRSW